MPLSTTTRFFAIVLGCALAPNLGRGLRVPSRTWLGTLSSSSPELLSTPTPTRAVHLTIRGGGGPNGHDGDMDDDGKRFDFMDASDDESDSDDDESEPEDDEWEAMLHSNDMATKAAFTAAIFADVGCLLAQHARRPEAVSAICFALGTAPPDWPARPRLLSALGCVLRELPDMMPTAITVLQAAAREKPADPNSWWNLGTACYQAGRQEEAAQAYTQACTVAHEDWEGLAPILNNLGTMLLDQIQRSSQPKDKDACLDAAVGALRESARREPDAACTLANLANALWASIMRPLENGDRPPGGGVGSPAPAFAGMHVENAGQLLPYVTSEQVERLDEVCAVLRHALDVVPKDWPHQDQLWMKLGVGLYAKGDFDGSAATLLDALRRTAHDPVARTYPPEWWCGVVHYMSVSLQRAKAEEKVVEQAFKLALDVCPELPEVRAEIGRSMLRLMMVDDALVQLHRALELADEQHGRGWGGRAAVLHAVGHAYAVNSELDKAIAAFRDALALEPLAASTRFLLSRALAENGETGAALTELEKAAKQGLWVSDRLMQGSAFEELKHHPRFRAIRSRMRSNEAPRDNKSDSPKK